MTTYVRERSGLHVLTNGAPMNAGGEGKIYRLSPTECLKIFHKPLPPHEIEKIHYLCTIRHKIAGFAWPVEPVRELNSPDTCGFVMPLVQGETLEDLIDKHQVIPRKQAISLCINIARAVQAAHDFPHTRIVLGDVIKAANIIVSGTDITFIDAASVSLHNLRHRNGSVGSSINRYVTPGYTAPERIQDPNRLPNCNQDHFALATLFFEILFGVSPYKPKPTPATIGFDPNEYVLKKRFFHFVAVPGIAAPTYPKINLPPEIDSLFRAALLTDTRPTARHWLKAMTVWANAKRVVRPQPQPAQPVQPQPKSPQPFAPGRIQPAQPTQPQPVSPVQPQPLAPAQNIPVQPQPTLQQQPAQPVRPKPIPAIQPQPPLQPAVIQPQYGTPPLTPINVPQQPIRIFIPTVVFVWHLFIHIPKFIEFVIRKLLALPGHAIEAVVNGIVDLVAFFSEQYWKLFVGFVSIIFITFTTSVTYRLIAVDLNVIDPKIPARSNSVTELVNRVFGRDGHIRIYKQWPDTSHSVNTDSTYPEPPSKNVGPPILGEIYK